MSADWGQLITGLGVLITGGATYLAYRRGTAGDKALSLSQTADRRSKETEANLTIQGSIIDQLQEEVARYRAELREKQLQLDGRDEQLEEYRTTLRDLRHELSDSRAGLSAAGKIIEGLEEQVKSLRLTVRDLKAQIARHEETITELIARERGRMDHD